MPLGISGFIYADLHDPSRLAALYAEFDRWFQASAPEAYAKFAKYRDCLGEGMSPEAVSEALLACAPWVSRFVGKLFRVERELETLRQEVGDREPLWRFRKEFAKKRILRPDAGKAWREGPGAHAGPGGDGQPGQSRRSVDVDARNIAKIAMNAVLPLGPGITRDEELYVARAVLLLVEVDDIARKAAKAGGATWTDALRGRAMIVRQALMADPKTAEIVKQHCATAGEVPTDPENGQLIAFVLDAIEAWLAQRRGSHGDAAAHWPSLHQPKSLDYNQLVELRRPQPKTMPELFVGPEEHRRERDGFALTDRRANPREVEQEIDYCMFCHERDKDSCSKGMRDAKTGALKKNPLGVTLTGCPLGEKISEFHTLRREGDALGALALITVDNPMCGGTGHRICNDCMKACIFQKQEPVNIPQIETRTLTEVLALPWGLEIYGLLTRWNPLNVRRPYQRPYNGKNVLVVGLGPAGYTLAHHLVCEGFGVVAIDGLKVEPLPRELVGHDDPGKSPTGDGSVPPPIRDFSTLYRELDERLLLGFGGVSEYGITVRWDKNFLTLLYITLARHRSLRMYGGIRFGGTLTLDDAWALGFDHVAIAAGAGRPTIIDMKNNLARGIRKASDFLMALQLTGAYKHSSIANLQVHLPAIVIGGGLTAIDTATELIAYYLVQVEKSATRYDVLVREKGEAAVRAMFDDEEWESLQIHLAHGREVIAEREAAAAEGRDPRFQHLVDAWGGVTLVYRKGLADSPAYRLNHEEVAKSLEEGVRYVENMSPTEAVLDERGRVKAVKFSRKDGTEIELPAKTVCVAAGTSPNVTYEREYEGSFELDKRNQYFQPHKAIVSESGEVRLEPVDDPKQGFFTSYDKGGKTVSFYGDNHPYYAGSVVKAMASAKDGYRHVVDLFPGVKKLDPAGQPARDRALRELFGKLDHELVPRVVEVNRLTQTIVEVVVKAPMAARKFKPGQFYRLQNFEAFAPVVDGTRLAMEGLALTGAWVDEEKGLLGTIVLEMGGSSRLCAALAPGEPVILMGPTGTPTEIRPAETVMLCGGGLGNAVLFSIARAFKALGSKVIYFAGYKRGEDLFKQDDVERWTDQVVWCTDTGATIAPRRPQDAHFRGNIVQAMVAYGKGELGVPTTKLSEVSRIIAIGSDRMMNAVREARHGVLLPLLDPRHLAIGSINSPMQCMMKEICAQCLQKQRDPASGEEYVVFSCFNQDQELDRVDFGHLAQRLRANSMQEKLSNAWLDRLLEKRPDLLRV
jgi:NADPH-dependent glutamate synthase beta subunit-like oxidoreductase/NAD(P)H-flavin reductase